MIFALAINSFQESDGQKTFQALSLEVITDFDKYSFMSVFNTSQMFDGVSGHGMSDGVILQYSRQLFKQWQFNIGVGFYNYTFNISRPFRYTGDLPNNYLHNTEKYIYRCFSVSGGLMYEKELNKKFVIIYGVNYIYYYTIQQKYIPFGPYAPQEGTSTFQFGNSVNLNTAFLKKINKYNVGVQLRVPFWENWRKDKIFDENQNEYNRKFFGGIGLGFIGRYSF